MKNFAFYLLIPIFYLLFAAPTFAARQETPKSIPGVTIITTQGAFDLIETEQCIQKKTCIFIDPRKAKDLKKGVIKGSVTYPFKKPKNMKEGKFIKSIQSKGYKISSLQDLTKYTIITGCNGKFCPRSPNLAKYLKQKLGSKLKILWVREEGVPGILRLHK